MKRFQLIRLMYVIAANTLVFTACKDDAKDTLTVTPTKLYFAAQVTAGQQVRVDSNIKDWSVVPSSESWLFINNKRDDGFTVSVAENTITAERTATITVKAGKAEGVISVTQEAGIGNITLTINPKSITFGANETATKNVTVTINAGSWNFSAPPDWLSLEKQGATLKVTPKNLNLSDKSRETTITITAGNATETIKITQEVSDEPVIKFVRADAFYYGDDYGIGTADYVIMLMNEHCGLALECFSTLLPDGADLKLDVGEYTYDNETGDAQTFAGGLYVDDSGLEIEITGGKFTVALSKDVYTIKAELSGKDAKGKKYPSLRYEFSGKIFFDDFNTPFPEVEFTDIPESGTYKAKGIPSWFEDGPETWTGKFKAFDDKDGQYYGFENFEETDWPHFCKFKDGGVFINGTKILGGNEKYNVYFRAALIDEDEKIYLFKKDWDYPVRYYIKTGILDFSTYFVDEEDGMRFTGVVGFFVEEIASGEIEGLYTDLYANLKYQLSSPVAPASKITPKSVLQNKKNLSNFKFRPSTGTTNIIKLDKSKMTKIPKSQLKVLDAKSFQPSIRKIK